MQKVILPMSFVLALAISFVLFAFMANLVRKPDNSATEPTKTILPDIAFEPRKMDDQTTKSHPVLKPQKTTPPPPTTQTYQQPNITAEPPIDGQRFKSDLPGLISGQLDDTVGGNNFKIGLNRQTQNGDATPIVQMEPRYPVVAARQGIEGWVKLAFDIDQTGTVMNIRVLESSPARMFDTEARRALKRWRYKAKFDGGRPIIQHNVTVQIDFSLEK